MQVNGVELHVEIDGRGAPLVLLHGFTGSSRAWDDLRPALVDRATVIGIDALGHGRSDAPADPGRYSLDHVAADLHAVLDGLGLGQVDLLGYSMGGRMALHFAVQNPTRVRRLMLESASPGLEDATERQQRIASDEALAARIDQAGIEAFVAEWERVALLQLAPHVPEAVRQTQHAQRLANRPIGLANSLRGLGGGQQMPLWDRLAELDVPVTLIVGQRDARYQAIGARMQAMLPHARLHEVPDAGHTVHLDQPRRFAELVQAALIAEQDGSAGADRHGHRVAFGEQ
jgi:2-succinyl-6-hydroxy-2,4-cyclohexadiene-1-carboxylate synthase